MLRLQERLRNSSPPKEMDTTKSNILIVDDSAMNRKLLRVQLEAEQHSIFEASDGVEALAVLERETVHAVISDILMPNMDGFGLCHALRRHPRLNALPFLLYTSTYTSREDRELAKTVGADGYLTKPASLCMILQVLEEAKQSAAARQTVARPEPVEPGVFKQYSTVLVNKLEEKSLELGATLEKLQIAHERIREQNRDLERRVKERTSELEKTNIESRAALADVKQLSGLLPICAWCKKIRDDQNYWRGVEDYISHHTEAEFTHGICPDCSNKVSGTVVLHKA